MLGSFNGGASRLGHGRSGTWMRVSRILSNTQPIYTRIHMTSLTTSIPPSTPLSAHCQSVINPSSCPCTSTPRYRPWLRRRWRGRRHRAWGCRRPACAGPRRRTWAKLRERQRVTPGVEGTTWRGVRGGTLTVSGCTCLLDAGHELFGGVLRSGRHSWRGRKGRGTRLDGKGFGFAGRKSEEEKELKSEEEKDEVSRR